MSLSFLTPFTSWNSPFQAVFDLSSTLFGHRGTFTHPSEIPECRCFPGDACWPSAAQWSTFNKSVDGRLVATVPIASVCHTGEFDIYSAEACADLQSIWHFPETHIDSSSSIMAPLWTNQSCDPFTSRDSVCKVGSHIQFAVNASEVSHYQRTLQFAKDNNIRFVIRNTGHDYYGKSNGAGALAVWTHHLQDIDMVDWKSPEYTGKAVKMGAGVQVHKIWEYLNKYGYVTPGGHCPTVGVAGGYTQGGGHGPLASAYGLGADQVLEWEVVDGTGKLLKANQRENQDLYWALSGGGGGTYGIVWSLTSKVYLDLPTSAGNLTFTSEGVTEDIFYDAVNEFVENLPALTDAGIAAVWFVMNGFFALMPIIGPGVGKAEMESLLAPTYKKLEDSKISYQSAITEYPDYLSSYDATTPPTNTSEYQIGGRLIPRLLVQNNMPALGAVIRNLSSNSIPVSGVTVNVGRQPYIPNNSVHPKWREALFSFVVGTLWNDTDWEQNSENQRLMTDVVMPQIERITPGGIVYLNEGNPFQPDWKDVFYGENYDRLREIKAKYDPDSMFYGRTAVGSDEWTQDNVGRLCKV